MATLLDAIGQYLPTQTASFPAKEQLTLGVNLFLGRLPAEAPNQVVLIQQYLGAPPSFTMGNAVSAIEHPRIQVLVRGNPEDYPGAFDLCEKLRQILGGITQEKNIDGVDILRIEPTGTPNLLNYDEVNRPRFIVNFRVMVQQ